MGCGIVTSLVNNKFRRYALSTSWCDKCFDIDFFEAL